ncbi:ECF transporter S component [Streptococcus halichoeri]|uniref:ECF transporter S component n=1 Tax=Streptococcus halichoeri TaxID=254785 RepID=UPI00135BF99A|nr:ECF transporter S component [Streptococcus halichoeri]
MFKTRQLVAIAILSTISFLLMFFSFSVIPGANFLKIDFSIIPILLGLVLFDLRSAYIILIFRTLLKFILNNSGVNDFIGLPMNIVAIGLFVTVFALIWQPRKRPKPKSYLLASIVGTLVLTITMVLLNYGYAIPLYAKFAQFDIKTMLGLSNYLLAMVVPFNLLEGALFALSFYFVYIACKPLIERY